MRTTWIMALVAISAVGQVRGQSYKPPPVPDPIPQAAPEPKVEYVIQYTKQGEPPTTLIVAKQRLADALYESMKNNPNFTGVARRTLIDGKDPAVQGNVQKAWDQAFSSANGVSKQVPTQIVPKADTSTKAENLDDFKKTLPTLPEPKTPEPKTATAQPPKKPDDWPATPALPAAPDPGASAPSYGGAPPTATPAPYEPLVIRPRRPVEPAPLLSIDFVSQPPDPMTVGVSYSLVARITNKSEQTMTGTVVFTASGSGVVTPTSAPFTVVRGGSTNVSTTIRMTSPRAITYMVRIQDAQPIPHLPGDE